jgi:hypothetical protein
MKTLLDFIVYKTTLDFRAFLKLEDLYSELFLVKCNILYLWSNYKFPWLWIGLVEEEWEGRKMGEPQSKFAKFTQGVLLFVGLILLLWFPLLLLMSGNPANSENPVYDVHVTAGEILMANHWIIIYI